MNFLLKGMAFVYAGQESMLAHRPSIFDKDPTDFAGGEDISGFIATCAKIKRTFLAADGIYGSSADDDKNVAYLWCKMDRECVVGIFSLKGYWGEIAAHVADGSYENLLTEELVSISGGKLIHDGKPIIVRLDADRFLEKEMRMHF